MYACNKNLKQVHRSIFQAMHHDLIPWVKWIQANVMATGHETETHNKVFFIIHKLVKKEPLSLGEIISHDLVCSTEATWNSMEHAFLITTMCQAVGVPIAEEELVVTVNRVISLTPEFYDRYGLLKMKHFRVVRGKKRKNPNSGDLPAEHVTKKIKAPTTKKAGTPKATTKTLPAPASSSQTPPCPTKKEKGQGVPTPSSPLRADEILVS